MSAFSGKHGKGAMRVRRALKRAEAEERNARTRPERRKVSRLGPVSSR